MGLFDTPLDGFTKEDFDVYQPQCWSSNLHNLQRMKTKEKLLSFVKTVASDLGVEGTSISSSSEIPSVWNGRQVKDQLVYCSRDNLRQKKLQSVIAREFDIAERIKAGAEHERHLILFARIEAECFTIGLRFTKFSLIDNRNLVARLSEDGDQLTQVIEAAAEVLSLDGEPLTALNISRAMERLAQGGLDAVELSKSWSRDRALELGKDVEEILAAELRTCEPLFAAALWTEENDYLKLNETLEELSAQVSASVEAKNQKREAKAEAHAQRAEAARERTGAKIEAEQAWRRLQKAKKPKSERSGEEDSNESVGNGERPSNERRSSSRGKSERSSPGERSATRRKASTRTARAAAETASTKKAARSKTKKTRQEPKKAWAVGDECTLSRGLFMGKRGTVVTAPDKGYVKVKVGVIEVSVSVTELDL